MAPAIHWLTGAPIYTTASDIPLDLRRAVLGRRPHPIKEDRVFAWLVFVSPTRSAGVTLLRHPGNAWSRLAPDGISLVQERGAEIAGALVVLQPGYIRISRQDITVPS